MFNKNKNFKIDKAKAFIDSLDYWENINLRIALIRNTNAKISDQEAYDQALVEYKNTDQLYYQLNKVLKTGLPI
ncbi:hypothetical protein NVV78_06625 [Pediococcus ethanolidurans]|uniref:hypothetical protein n=1 Tax=Pediococcus ethanolidurans TaxID=319653 RepID=UPI0021E96D95|nr:hypothetical protein [Pediococcus ethanolidurans]MCV3315616.1 hypothetical protein [Pediococcus ethanolidurans]